MFVRSPGGLSGLVSFTLAGMLGCGSGEVDVEAASDGELRLAADPELAGDDLLAQARRSMRGGAVDSQVQQRILASEDPVHARAKRILAALAGPSVVTAPNSVSSSVPLVPPPIVAPAPVQSVPLTKKRPSLSAKPVAHVPAAATRLDGVTLKKSRRGAKLTLRANAGMVVGVANQRHSQLVRLVVDVGSVSASALRARPQVTGARVTSVRTTKASAFITLQLEQGWSLGKIRRSSVGATIELVAPG